MNNVNLTMIFFSLCTLSGFVTAEDYDPKINPQPPVRPIDKKGFHLGFPKAHVTPMLSGEDTSGAFNGAVEHVHKDYYGPPHVHYEKSETIIVTGGIALLRVAGTDYTLTEGQWLHIPAGNVHSFRSNGAEAKWVILQHPGRTMSSQKKPSPECDRSSFSEEMNKDPAVMSTWYHICVPDFYMVPEAGLPYEK
jgi:quercetin dioxygenase-like cupin family protein